MFPRLISLFLILLIGSPLCCCGKTDGAAEVAKAPACCHSESTSDSPKNHDTCPCKAKQRGLEATDIKAVSVVAPVLEMVAEVFSVNFELTEWRPAVKWSVAGELPPPVLGFQTVYCVYLI